MAFVPKRVRDGWKSAGPKNESKAEAVRNFWPPKL